MSQQEIEGERLRRMLKILLITIILVAIAFAGLGIRILLERNGEFSGGSCQSASNDPDNHEISCGCEHRCKTDKISHP